MKKKEPFCPLASISNALVNKEHCECQPDCALRIRVYQTTESINVEEYVCALAARWLLDDKGRLKV